MPWTILYSDAATVQYTDRDDGRRTQPDTLPNIFEKHIHFPMLHAFFTVNSRSY